MENKERNYAAEMSRNPTYRKMEVKRKQKLQKLAADEVRATMEPERYIQDIMALQEESKDCLISELPRLKFQTDINFGLLKKCLPDLKQVEHIGEIKHQVDTKWEVEFINASTKFTDTETYDSIEDNPKSA